LGANALSGYEDFVVIGAFAGAPETIHTRAEIASLEDLRGKAVRVNNMGQAAALKKLGIEPVLMPINKVPDAMIGGRIDGATAPPAMLFEFGIGRAARHHFLLPTSSAPLTVLMNRKKFESLSPQTQSMILIHSGGWAVTRFIQSFDAVNVQAERKLISDPRRKVIVPSQSDRDRAGAAYDAVVAEWSQKTPHNRALLESVKSVLAKLRAE
jgi:TRAP-type C4-dicarboxylate transport system substrate-binding protein